MLRTHPLAEKLPLSTAALSNIALALLLWNMTLRLALLLGDWVAGAAP
jgi:hypothetical protein